MKSRQSFIDSIVVDNVIAFRINDDMLSGKVIDVEDDRVTVKTKNGSVYYVDKSNITWVKNGSFYPVGIYNALKFTERKNRNEG